MEDSSVCIYGSGSIGLDLAWNLIRSDHKVTIISREPTLEILQAHGIKHLGFPGERIQPTSFRLVSSASDAGVHRYIFLTTKVDALLEICDDVKHLIGPQSLVISATNGIPPWYSYLQDDTIGRFTFPTEPRETFIAAVPSSQLVGAIVERSVQLSAPAVIQQASGKGYTIGELHHRESARCDSAIKLLASAGFSNTRSTNIHRDIWLKLIGNVAINPLSVLTELSVGKMIANDRTMQRMRRLTQETAKVGIRLGVIRPTDFREEQFFKFSHEQLSDHRSSMLQDFHRGKKLEIHRILEVVEMLAKAPGPLPVVETPAIKELDRELKLKVVGNLTHEK